MIAAAVGFWLSISLGRPESQQVQPSNAALPAAKLTVEGYGKPVSGRDTIPRRRFSRTRDASKMPRHSRVAEDAIYDTPESLPEKTITLGDGVLSPGLDGKPALENRRIPNPGIRYRF